MKLSEIKEKLEVNITEVEKLNTDLANSLKENIGSFEKWYDSEEEQLRDEIEEKEEEIDDLEDSVKDLERQIDDLEDGIQEFPIQTLEDEMKVELLQVLFNKYSLRELEEKLGGNKFTL
jgi:chromosome segregation ATPase